MYNTMHVCIVGMIVVMNRKGEISHKVNCSVLLQVCAQVVEAMHSSSAFPPSLLAKMLKYQILKYRAVERKDVIKVVSTVFIFFDGRCHSTYYDIYVEKGFLGLLSLCSEVSRYIHVHAHTFLLLLPKTSIQKIGCKANSLKNEQCRLFG